MRTFTTNTNSTSNTAGVPTPPEAHQRAERDGESAEQPTRYLSCAQTATLVRSALKQSFPGIRFAVRSRTYSGGASMNVAWTDGPSDAQVKSIVCRFAGSSFDSSTDCATHINRLFDGRRTNFGADYIFCHRDASDAAIAAAIDRVYGRFENHFTSNGMEKPSVAAYDKGHLTNVQFRHLHNDPSQNLESDITLAIGQFSYCPIAMTSATLARFDSAIDGVTEPGAGALNQVTDRAIGYGSTAGRKTETQQPHGGRNNVQEDAVIAHALAILAKRLYREPMQLSSPRLVEQYLTVKLAQNEHEVFLVLWLDYSNRLIACEELFRGTVSQCSVYPREIVKAALAHNAAAAILAHCHPSGSTNASTADIALTKTLAAALALVDVRVVDHFIVGGASVSSFAEKGLL